MNKGVIYYTKIREEYVGAHMEHMIAEKLLETALRKEYNINLSYEPRAEGEHGKPFLSYRPSLHYNISHSGEYVVCILADQEVGIDIQIHRKANYERCLSAWYRKMSIMRFWQARICKSVFLNSGYYGKLILNGPVKGFPGT